MWGFQKKKEKKRVCGGVVVCTGEFHGLCRSSYFFCSLYTEYFFPFSCTNFVIGLNFRSNIFVLMPRIDFAVLLWRSILSFFQGSVEKRSSFLFNQEHKNL